MVFRLVLPLARRVGLTIAVVAHAAIVLAQAQSSRLSGYVRDATGMVVSEATVVLTSDAMKTTRQVRTNTAGFYDLSGLSPGLYSLKVVSVGLDMERALKVQLELGQNSALDIVLHPAGVSESVSVNAEPPILGTRDGSVSTVVDHRFTESLPLNGRSFQSLLELTPGVVTVAGGFSVAGQRSDANYFTVDGVSAQSGVTVGLSLLDSASGQAPATNVAGSYTALASLGAIQDIQIQTSSFAPEYGRTPGAQVSIATRSGTSTFHGSALYAFRNDALDARNWFVNYRGLPKPPLRQHAPAASLGGPLIGNRLFFFGVYDGLALTQPTILNGDVPSAALRQSAADSLKPVLNAFPLPTGSVDARGIGPYTAAGATTIRSNTYSARLDAPVSPRLQLFGHYSDTPSTLATEQVAAFADTSEHTRTLTLGVNMPATERTVIEARANYSQTTASAAYRARLEDGATDVPASWYPSELDPAHDFISSSVFSAGSIAGFRSNTRQRQINLLGSIARVFRAHTLKAGVDYRHLDPQVQYADHEVLLIMASAADISTGNAGTLIVRRHRPVSAGFNNLSLYAQDGWRLSARTTVTYGLRWDLNPPPAFDSGSVPIAAQGTSDPSTLTFAAPGTSLWTTNRRNLAPRVGIAQTLDASGKTVVTGGIGVFYDLGTQSSSALVTGGAYPNQTDMTSVNVPLPLSSAAAQGLPIANISQTPPYTGVIYLVDPNIETPRTFQWNARVERQLSTLESLSVAYVAAKGERLLTTAVIRTPNAQFPGIVRLLGNGAESSYSSMQVQYRRRVSRGLQGLVSYTLASARDNGSLTNQDTGAFGLAGVRPKTPADFDIRHTLTGAISWHTPDVSVGSLSPILNGWETDLLVRARSGEPFTVYTGVDSLRLGSATLVRPNLVAGVPMIIDDPGAPGGRRVNAAAFVAPTTGRQGDLARNSLRWFPASQADLSFRRSLHVTPAASVQLSLSIFNVLNTPNFARPRVTLSDTQFGRAQTTLNEQFAVGGLNPVYQWGGSRSIELGVKCAF